MAPLHSRPRPTLASKFSLLNSSNGAVIEKISNGRNAAGPLPLPIPRNSRLYHIFNKWFKPLPVYVPGLNRWVEVPVLYVFHPSSSPILPAVAPNSQFSRPLSYNGSPTEGNPFFYYSPLRTIFALLSTFLIALCCFLFTTHIFRVIFLGRSHRPFSDPSTLSISQEEIRRVWEYEIASGHYPSWRRIPLNSGINGTIRNPGLPRDGSVLSKNAILSNDGIQHGSIDTRNQLGGMRAQGVFDAAQFTVPVGLPRDYLPIPKLKTYSPHNASQALNFPPRPLPNSVLDLDIVMDYCDFSTNQYVRDCLEILRMGANLDINKRSRRGNADKWRHIYRELPTTEVDHDSWTPTNAATSTAEAWNHVDVVGVIGNDTNFESTIRRRQANTLKGFQDHAVGTTPKTFTPHPSHPTADPTCNPDFPRIFHIFWTGPFTDKPYIALSSFLYTQNLGLHLNPQEDESSREKSDFLAQVCRPQLWIWCNPGPAALLPAADEQNMFDTLADNPWSAPFLHPRFKEVIKFKLWNTTEQLDSIPELKDHWRTMPVFNSGGVKYANPDEKKKAKATPVSSPQSGIVAVGANGEEEELSGDELGRFGEVQKGEDAIAQDQAIAEELKTVSIDWDQAHPAIATFSNSNPPRKASANTSRSATSPAEPTAGEDDLFHRVGSTSSQGYDRLSTVLSDMVRFVVTYRFGGIYLDADTILLRDWEELWGWKGQFAYRWSRLEKYNTAVLKLNRNSAMGSFLFRTALKNGLDFHPMTISKYTKDAYLEPLLLRLPDALFDPAWLNTEYYQRDRPPFPYFKRFEDFFDTPNEEDAVPAVAGMEAFFKGAFSYHFHNFWWEPFDPRRSWPDLGPRFIEGERKARRKVKSLTAAGRPHAEQEPTSSPSIAVPAVEEEDDVSVDDWRDDVSEDERDLGWATVLKRTFESYLRGERPNYYGEWIDWGNS